MAEYGPLVILAPESRCFSDQDLVLSGLDLVPGIDMQSLSKFGDDIWEIYPAIHAPSTPTGYGVVRWSTIIKSPYWRLAIKEFVYARLHFRVNKYSKIKPLSVMGIVRYCTAFLKAMEDQGIYRLSNVTQESLNIWFHELRENSDYTLSYIARLLDVPVQLYTYSSYLSEPSITFFPWEGISTSRLVGYKKSRENITPRIPATVINPLLKAALWYVNHASTEIIAARKHQNYLDSHPWDPSLTPRERLLSYVDTLRQTDRGIPDLPRIGRFMNRPIGDDQLDRLNKHAIHQETGVDLRTAGERASRSANQEYLKIIRNAVIELGYQGDRTVDPKLEPLTQLLKYDLSGQLLLWEEANLIAACYIVVAYLSGMRDSEVESLRQGCVHPTRSKDGVIELYEVNGLVYKGRNTAINGEAASWVVLKPVDDAIKVLENLIRLRYGEDESRLFIRTSQIEPSRYTSDGKKLGHHNVNLMINRFARHINSLASRSSTLQHIPDIDGKPWYLTSRQFRRTIAWFIANEPLGIIAGSMQYKHVETAIFEGYAGQSDSNFITQLNNDQVDAKRQDIISLYISRKRGATLVGQAAERLVDTLDHIRNVANDYPNEIVDIPLLHSMLKDMEHQLHHGVLCDCFYQYELAVCKQHATQDSPAISRCTPENCPNAIITDSHKACWLLARKSAQQHLDYLLRQPNRKHLAAKIDYLRSELERFNNILDQGVS